MELKEIIEEIRVTVEDHRPESFVEILTLKKCEIEMVCDAAERSIKLEAENKILMGEFEYLANIENYKSPSSGFALQYDPEKSPIEKRGGAWGIARDVLEKLK